jgi:hypothetical protein
MISAGTGALWPDSRAACWWLPPTTAFGAGPSRGRRALLRPGLLSKMFLGRRAAIDENGASLCLREWKKVT